MNPDFFKYLCLLANITVKIVATVVSQRPDVRLRTGTEYPHCDDKGRSNINRVGTGTIVRVMPRSEEQGQGEGSKSFELKVLTSRHHVWNDAELRGVQIEISFPHEEGKTILSRTFKADSLTEYSAINMDTCALSFFTCDNKLGDTLHRYCDQFWKMAARLNDFSRTSNNDEILALVSYPHGVGKCISLGKVTNSLLYLTESTTSAVYILALFMSFSPKCRLDKDMCAAYTTPTCYGSSGALVVIPCGSESSLKVAVHEGHREEDGLNHSGNPEFIWDECFGVSENGNSGLCQRQNLSKCIGELNDLSTFQSMVFFHFKREEKKIIMFIRSVRYKVFLCVKREKTLKGLNRERERYTC